MLKRQLERLAALKMRAFFASELEFYLFDESHAAIAAREFRAPRTISRYIEDYHVLQTTKEEPVMRAIRNGLQNAGIPVENSKGEWGPASRRSTSVTRTHWRWRTVMSSSRTPSRRSRTPRVRR